MPPITRSVTCSGLGCGEFLDSLDIDDAFVTCNGEGVAFQVLADAVELDFIENDLGDDAILAGTLAARPAAGIAGRLYLATNDNGGTFYRDNGVSWDQCGFPVSLAATTSTSGIVELSTSGEVTTGTASTVVTCDSLAGSDFGKRIVTIQVFDDNAAVSTGDGKKTWFIPAELNGMNLVAAHATVTTVSSGAAPTVQIHNLTDGQDMLSTRITIDANEFTSYTATTPPVINASYDDVATGDRIRIDVDVAGTGTTGLSVILTFQLP